MLVRMGRMRFLFGVVCLLSMLPATSCQYHSDYGCPFQKQPNILFILTDDMGWNDIGYHNDAVQTPVLDELALNGRKLESAYSLPACSPSRAALMTGRYPYTTGMQHVVILPGFDKPMPVNLLTLQEALKTTGYQTHLVGKWHLGDCSTAGLPTNRGFDSFVGFLNGEVDYYTKIHRWQNQDIYDFFNGTELIDNSTEYIQDILELETIRLIRNSEESAEPFFILHSTPIPHVPMRTKPDNDHLYPSVAEPRRSFLRMMATLDESVGRIVQALDDSGQRENTVIIFMSDNGGMANGFPGPPWGGFPGSNYPLRGSKGSLFEGGMRVPAFINSPLLPDHMRCTETDALFHMTDWLPTILSWAGGNKSQLVGIDGVDQTSVLFGPAPDDKYSVRDHIVLQILDLQFFAPANYSNTSAAVRWRDYKLTTGNALVIEPLDENLLKRDLWSQPAEWDVEGSKERKKIVGTDCGLSPTDICLYNIKEDPSETRDISAEHPDVVNRLLCFLEYEKRRIQQPVTKGLSFQTYPVANITDSLGRLVPGYCD